MKKGFTLVELLVVIGMLMLPMGSVSSAVMSARNRAKIAKATATCQEMTNAILAFENYRSLADKATGDTWKEVKRNEIRFLLGEESSASGEKIPVLFNADIAKNELKDPWGNPYWYKIVRKTQKIKDTAASTLRTQVFFPNFNRRLAGED